MEMKMVSTYIETDEPGRGGGCPQLEDRVQRSASSTEADYIRLEGQPWLSCKHGSLSISGPVSVVAVDKSRAPQAGPLRKYIRMALILNILGVA